MRNVPIGELDHTPRPVVATGADYPHGFLLAHHAHRRAQLLYGATGLMKVTTAAGNWVVPPQHAVWIPPGVGHEVVFLGVSTWSLYIEPAAVPASRRSCEVISITPLMRHLLKEAVAVPLEYDEFARDGALMQLALCEIGCAPALAFHIPLPGNAQLLARCERFIQAPNIHESPQDWAKALFMSERTFARVFRAQTTLSFSQWRQRATVVLALARLSAGDSITRIALEFGYESPAAFSTMFRRVLGQPPKAYLDNA